MIPKADAEIAELKEELVILESQLGWLDEDWSKGSTALKEKIDYLGASIHALKSNKLQDHELGDHEKMPREPAEKIHDILQALLPKCSQETDNQVLFLIHILIYLHCLVCTCNCEGRLRGDTMRIILICFIFPVLLNLLNYVFV